MKENMTQWLEKNRNKLLQDVSTEKFQEFLTAINEDNYQANNMTIGEFYENLCHRQ